MSSNLFLVLDGYWHWLWSVAVPMDGIKCHQFRLSPFLRLGLGKKNFEEGKLLNINLGASSNCKRGRTVKIVKNVKR